MTEDSNAKLIENITLLLHQGIQTIQELSRLLNTDKKIIKDLLEKEFISNGFAVCFLCGDISHYKLSDKGETEAEFLEIGRGEFKIECETLTEEELCKVHEQILHLLINSTPNNPIILYEKFFELYPEYNKSVKQFTWEVSQLEAGEYIINNTNSGYFITERGKKLLETAQKKFPND